MLNLFHRVDRCVALMLLTLNLKRARMNEVDPIALGVLVLKVASRLRENRAKRYRDLALELMPLAA